MSDLKCPKCGAEMQEGYIFGHKIPNRWVSGKPERSLLWYKTGLGKDHRHVEAHRCVTCGYLELYAREASYGL